MLLSIVIPCLNEEKTILKVVLQARSAARKAGLRDVEILVADNGSIDASVEKVKKQGIARLVAVPIRGYGAALHWGILKAKGKFILYADADLSYNFGELKKFLPYIPDISGSQSKKKGIRSVKGNSRFDLILGSRFLGKIKKNAMPPLHRYLGTPILTFLIRTIYGLPTTDCNSGMRMVRKSFYQSLGMQNSGMEWASELLIKTALAGGHYAEVPITLSPDKRGRPPHLVSWADGWRHFKAIFLLKPNSLFLVSGAFFLLSWIAFFKDQNISVFCFLTAITFFFCTLAAKLIKYSIDGKASILSEALLRLPLVHFLFVFFFLGIVQFFIFPNQYQILKMVILHIILTYCIWVFFIETIKTHVVNKLPN